jgi:GT2 family glycosyltransferase
VKIVVVVVLYNTNIGECHTLHSLICAREAFDPDVFSLLLYDNGSIAQPAQPGAHVTYEYVHDPKNGGLSAAYNCALACAQAKGASWLLLLDQDTTISAKFLLELRHAAEGYEVNLHIAAIIPKIISRGVLISPARVNSLGRKRPIRSTSARVLESPVTAINSGTLVRASFIQSLGGFERRFWLDFLDHWLFNRIYAGRKVVVLLDATLEHDLSVTNLANGMSEQRYVNILDAEAIFVRDFGDSQRRLVYPLYLLARACKNLIVDHDARFFRLTLSHAFRQIVDTRSTKK